MREGAGRRPLSHIEDVMYWIWYERGLFSSKVANARESRRQWYEGKARTKPELWGKYL